MSIKKRVRAVALGALLICGFSSGAGAVSILYGQGHSLDTSRLSTFGGHALTSTFTQNNAGWALALGGGLGAFGAIVLSHPTSSSSLSAGTIASITSYVSGGGRLIVGGDHGVDEDDLLNAAFGYSTSVASNCGFSNSPLISITPAAAGTSFAGAPATIADLSCVTSLNGAPGIVMYTGLGGDVVSMDTFGAGIVGWYGWDFNTAGSAAQRDDWYKVLDASLTYTATAVPEPATLTLFGLGLLGLGVARRRKKLAA